ncbi:MAG: type II secretion system protein [Dehalococcoidia bacterium]|nr:type II secretion system protein [Desulfobacterales bacterium]MDZ4246958.1 type II secretion system protein [Dehalococcoidia bacterium]
MKPLLRNQRGFTLLEIIAVLLVMGIISAVAVARYSSTNSELTSQTDLVRTRLRYAQLQAFNSNVVWGINFSATSYSLFKNGNTSDTARLPGEGSTVVTLPAGISISTGIVSFDSWGTPYTDGPAASIQSGARSLTVTAAGGSKTITITPNTGFIP